MNIVSCCAWVAALGVSLLGGVGCGPKAGGGDEQQEAYFLEGRARLEATDIKGAIDAFERATGANPRNASAHLELAFLCDQRVGDHVAAIHHYERFLILQPDAGERDAILQRILACKLELVRTISPAPGAQPASGVDAGRLAAENLLLRQQIRRLEEMLSRRVAGRLADMKPGVRTSQSYMVRSGESLASIAAKLNVKVEALLAANPGLDGRRIRTGQVLKLPPE